MSEQTKRDEAASDGTGNVDGAARHGLLNHIRVLRFHAGEMTQQELARRIGVSRQTLNAIEGGKYSPSLEVAFKIARVFGTPLDRVFEYAGEE